MSIRRRDIFTTVRTEGGILPADLLQRIVMGDKSLKELTSEDYYLLPGEKINEAINRSWNVMRGAWDVFRAALEKLPTGDPGTSLTRERLLLPLFQQLGYGRLQLACSITFQQPAIGDAEPGPGIQYPISHGWNHVPIHLVGWFRRGLLPRH